MQVLNIIQAILGVGSAKKIRGCLWKLWLKIVAQEMFEFWFWFRPEWKITTLQQATNMTIENPHEKTIANTNIFIQSPFSSAKC